MQSKGDDPAQFAQILQVVRGALCASRDGAPGPPSIQAPHPGSHISLYPVLGRRKFVLTEGGIGHHLCFPHITIVSGGVAIAALHPNERLSRFSGRPVSARGSCLPESAMDQHAVIIANANGFIQFWSAGAVSLFGHAAIDAVGKRLDLVVPPDLREMHWKGFGHAMQTASMNGEGTFFDIPGLCSNGGIRPLRGQLHLLRDENRMAIGAMAIFTAATG
jgi:PAS domain S-box-containing protein